MTARKPSAAPVAMTDKRIAKIEARANAATPGPWEASFHSVSDFDKRARMSMEWTPNGGEEDDMNANHEADGAFMAHARADVPALIAEVRRLRRLLATPAGREAARRAS